jgi:alpha-glucoside transport system permease protein
MDGLVSILTTIVGVAIAVGVFSALWVGINLMFNRATKDWQMFSTLAGAALGFLLMVLLHGNELLINPLDEQMDQGTIGRFIAFIWLPLIAAGIGAGVGYFLGHIPDPNTRLAIGVGTGVVASLVIAMMLRDGSGVITIGEGLETEPERSYLPSFRPFALINWTVIGAAVGAGWATLRKSNLIRTTALFGSAGWLIGSFAASQLGTGPRIAAVIACLIPGLAVGYVIGTTKIPDVVGAARIDEGSRPWIFVGPAVFFIFVALVAPTILTGILSFQNNDSTEFVGFDNYGTVLSDANNFDTADWTNIFTSRLFILGLILFAIGLLLTLALGRKTGQTTQIDPPSGAIGIGGIALIFFAIVTTLRGTIVNNLWWVFAVTLLATSLGLAIAVLADNVQFERVAKSIIFMPLAISFVGASVVWRLVYQSRDPSQNQTGAMNAAWLWIGRTTADSTIGQIIWGVLLVAALLGFATMAVRSLGRDVNMSVLYAVLGVVPIYLLYRLSTGGFGALGERNGEFRGEPIQTLSEGPWNNFFLMIVLIWIQTGFAMVILSAAIKAVPGEFIEAAKIDGANDSDIFWRITIPQIAPTIIVVLTTIIVLVMKVFDIVRVMTNGNFGTNVLANAMYGESFQFRNVGVGSTLAILLFLSVLPVMVYNIRKQQKEVA